MVLAEAIQSGTIPALLVCDRDRVRDHEALLGKLEDASCDILLVPPEMLRSLSDTRTPQGMVAAFPWIERQAEPADLSGQGIFIALDRLQDPGNLGTILRTADAVGARGVILSPGCVDPTNAKVVRSAMGSLFRVPVFKNELTGVLAMLRQAGWRTYCGHLDGRDFFERTKSHGRAVLIVGNEAAGVSDPVASACDEWVRLPMPGGAPSLNAAVAAGIMLYDLMRDNRPAGIGD